MVTQEKTRTTSGDLLATLTTHIQELAEATDAAHLSEQMQTYLDFCARFHRYSPNNVWLIMLACPHARMVAGFHKWRLMGRFVRRGEKGIPILAPMMVNKEDENGEKEKFLTGFRVVYVFDISQTDGEPLPEPPDWKSPEKNLELQEKLLSFAAENNIVVRFKQLEGEIQGVSKGGVIEISPEAGTKTLVHEVAHELMHQQKGIFQESRLMELEAEAVAYLVAKHFGLDNLSSPNYIALHGAKSEMIHEHMERILEIAGKIIASLEQ